MIRHRFLLTATMLAALLAATATEAKAQSVTEEILEILKQSGKVTEEKYQELKTRAAAENKAEQKAEENYRVYWKSGLRFESPEGDFKLKLGGRIQNDWAILKPSGAIQEEFDQGDLVSGGKIRRARLAFSGTLYENFVFKAQYDFANAVVGIKDLYIGAQNVPFIDTILIGHMKEPYSLEQMTSSNNITFMERGAGATLDAARNTGVTIYPRFLDKRVGWDLGAYLNTADTASGFSIESLYNVTTRLYGVPWWQEGGRRMAFIGGSFTHQFRNGDTVSYSGRPNTSFGPKLISTGDVETNGNDLINVSAAIVVDSFSAQAEYSHSFIDSPSGPDVDFFSWYVLASWFLTGEHRPMNLQKGAFGAVQPKNPFGWGPGSGWGALQVAARFSQLDLDSGTVEGGQLNDTTLGLNWYLNPALRFTFNYIYSDREPIGSENIWQCRFQVAF